MILTKDEAQELIAEIKKNRWEQYCNDRSIFSGAIIPIEKIEKIINRFASKPPGHGYNISNINKQSLTFFGCESQEHKQGVLVLRTDGRYEGEFVFTPELLKQHIEHCNSMLEYLQDE